MVNELWTISQLTGNGIDYKYLENRMGHFCHRLSENGKRWHINFAYHNYSGISTTESCTKMGDFISSFSFFGLRATKIHALRNCGIDKIKKYYRLKAVNKPLILDVVLHAQNIWHKQCANRHSCRVSTHFVALLNLIQSNTIYSAVHIFTSVFLVGTRISQALFIDTKNACLLQTILFFTL